jgi:peptide/nickel transport system substrate-binding protein
LLLAACGLLLVACSANRRAGGELSWCLRADPKTFNPIMVDDDPSDTVRYLTGDVLVRVNRVTQKLEPELATTWEVSPDGRTITFTLRDQVRYSDGTPFGPDDVVYTVQQMMDPALHSPLGDSFRSGEGKTATSMLAGHRVAITFPAPVAGLEGMFDGVFIMSAHSPLKEKAALGPYVMAEYKPGAYVLFHRNPNYWKRDQGGRPLPYVNSVRLVIQPNRDIETVLFQRGEIQLINSIDSEFYDRLAPTSAAALHDAGPSFDTEQMWFNQVAKAPLPAYKRDWFRSRGFRRAVSAAVNRDDLARVAFNGKATPAVGPVSPANKVWFNAKLTPPPHDPAAALQSLQAEGFRMQKGALLDRGGHPVEFSIITNAGNKYRERMAVMIQQDLAQIGMKVNVVTLDFPSLIERVSERFNYEAALLGLVNVDPDPNAQMNVWLSSGENHQWNPKEKSPETDWEAEIDRLMKEQASSVTFPPRKAAWDRVQEIVVEQAPFIYLVNKNALSAVSPKVRGAMPVALRPQTFWNIESLSLEK